MLNITIQGLIPKRRNDIAKSIGNVVEKEPCFNNEIFDRLVTEENKQEVIAIIKEKLLKVIDYKFGNYTLLYKEAGLLIISTNK